MLLATAALGKTYQNIFQNGNIVLAFEEPEFEKIYSY